MKDTEPKFTITNNNNNRNYTLSYKQMMEIMFALEVQSELRQETQQEWISNEVDAIGYHLANVIA